MFVLGVCLDMTWVLTQKEMSFHFFKKYHVTNKVPVFIMSS